MRLIVCAAAVWFVVSRLEWDRLLKVAATAEWRWVVVAFFVLGPVPFAMAVRLQWLLAANDIHLTLKRAVGVTFAASFANFVLPGQTGGDVVKIIFIARDTHRRHEAATVVMFDRLLGLMCVTVLCAVMLLANWNDPAVKGWGRTIGVTIAALIVPCVLYFSMWFRRLIRWEWLLEKLPLSLHLKRIDAAVMVYRKHTRVVAICAAMTFALQAIAIFATVLIGRALGVAGATGMHTVQVYFVYIPLCWMVGALPISPQGLGVVELAYQELLYKAAGFGTAEGAAMISVLMRLAYFVWALPGLVYYLKMGRPTAAEAAAATPVSS